MRSLLSIMRRYWKLPVVVLAVMLAVILVLVSGVFTWSPLNCWHQDVDINSGRVRHTRYLLYCKVGDRVEDTWLSRAAERADEQPNWQRVVTFSPGTRHSPHYIYHSATNQIKSLEQIDSMIPLEPEARRKVADTLLTLWQSSGDDFDADRYVQALAVNAFKLQDNGASVMKVSDLPDRPEGGD